MSSTCSHFVFFLFAPKELLAASVSENATPVTIHCRLSRLIPQIWKHKTPKELFFAGHIDAFVVDAGPDFLVFQCYSMTTDSFVTYYREILKIHICFTATEWVPLGTHSVGVKQCKRERRFRFLGHIPHILVDDGALFAFSLSETRKTTSVH